MDTCLTAREHDLYHKKYCFDIWRLHNISAPASTAFSRVKSASAGKARVQVKCFLDDVNITCQLIDWLEIRLSARI